MKFNAENFFKEMYYFIWQSNDLSKFDDYYAKDFYETISVSNQKNNPIELTMDYNELKQQAIWHQEKYYNTTVDFKKIIGNECHIAVNFQATSIYKPTDELQHRCAAGIWQLNEENKIDRAWAVVTPYYQ